MYNRTLTRVLLAVVAAGLLLTFLTETLTAAARESRERAARGEEILRSERYGAGWPEEADGPGFVTSGPGSALKDQRKSLYEEYLKKFRDTEETIARMNASAGGGGPDAEADAAARELRFWETQLNSLFQTIMEMLPAEEAAVLSRDQQDWRKKREEAAAEAVRQNSRSRNQRTDYLAAQADSTRERVWTLLEHYRSELESATRYGPGS